ncbi:MAG: single-stranded DNA-binding protein [Candidatus Poribacteria bacterium]|nr:single-stranded DNA-binding protein [Candidatus Poribacteria bacterium]
MAAEFNKVIMLGRLTQDPELRHLDSGTAVATLRLASGTSYTTRDGERKEDTCFIDVSVWDRTAENCCQYLGRGSQVLVEGRLKYEQWETETGEKRSTYRIQAFTVQFLGSPRDSEGGGFAKEEGEGGYTRSQPSYDRASGGRGFSGGDQSEPSDEPIDDDIPF